MVTLAKIINISSPHSYLCVCVYVCVCVCVCVCGENT